MKTTYKGLIRRLQLLCILWSLTSLTTGMAFVYMTMYEYRKDEFDLFFQTYSIGVSIGGVAVSLLFSIYLHLYRKAYEHSITL